jgi:hypothetical protein
MTDQQLGVVMILVGLAVILSRQRKKRQNSPARGEIVFIEMIEMIEVRKSRKVPEFVVNLAIVAGIVAFIWVMNR